MSNDDAGTVQEQGQGLLGFRVAALTASSLSFSFDTKVNSIRLSLSLLLCC
jgi:hypothetical protein